MPNVNLSDKHLKVIIKALEVYYRLKSGQIQIALDTAYDHALAYIDADAAQEIIRRWLPQFKDFDRNSSYGVGAKELGDANIAYEINKTFQEYLSVQKNDGYYGYTVDFHGPLKVSDEPLPKIREHKPYKDFPLTRKQSAKLLKLLNKNDYVKIWESVREMSPDLPKGEKQEIILDAFKGEEAVYGGDNTRIVIRVHKPQKP